MSNKWYQRKTVVPHYVDAVHEVIDDLEEITDELEKSLWELKERFDLDTEEVSQSIEGYRENKGGREKEEKEEEEEEEK